MTISARTLVQMRYGEYEPVVQIPTDRLLPSTIQSRDIWDDLGIERIDTQVAYLAAGSLSDLDETEGEAMHSLYCMKPGWSLIMRDTAGHEHSYGAWWPYAERLGERRLTTPRSMTIHSFAGHGAGTLVLVWRPASVFVTVLVGACEEYFTVANPAGPSDPAKPDALESLVQHHLHRLSPQTAHAA